MNKPNYAVVDLIRLLEGRHNLAALKDVAVLVPEGDPHHAGVTASRDALAAEWRGLSAAAASNFGESRETAEARMRTVVAADKAKGRYDYALKQADANWATPNPDVVTPVAETALRRAAFKRIFSLTASDIRNLGPEKLVEHLAPVVTSMAGQDGLAALGLHQKLDEAVVALTEANDVWQKERKEDKTATRALDEARESFDRADRAHALLVESVLVRRGESDRLGEFLKARDPAYAARRDAGVAIEEEPEIGDLDNDPLEPPA